MAVFTEVTEQEASGLMANLGLGTLQSMQGCASGIENTNYFVSTDQGDYVLTLFERLSFEQLPFYLNLMHHLAARGIPVPAPQANAQGDILHTLKGKPAAVVTRLKGRNQLAPQAADCAQVGAMLARMHMAGQDYPAQQPNLRGLAWWTETVPVVILEILTGNIDPQVNAMGTAVFLVSITLVVIAQMLVMGRARKPESA